MAKGKRGRSKKALVSQGIFQPASSRGQEQVQGPSTPELGISIPILPAYEQGDCVQQTLRIDVVPIMEPEKSNPSSIWANFDI